MAHLGLRKISEEKDKHRRTRQESIDAGLPPPPFSELLENCQPWIDLVGGPPEMMGLVESEWD
jgi:hypothetical protein